MNIDKFKDLIKKYPWIAYPLIALGALGLVSLPMMFTESKPAYQHDASKQQVKHSSGDIGISVGGADKEAYLARLEKNYYDFEDRVKSMESQMKSVEGLARQLKGNQKEISDTVLKLDENLAAKMNERLENFKQEVNSNKAAQTAQTTQAIELAVADINPMVAKEGGGAVYLPLGSFCKGTLLTGVWASADQNNPLPVLIALDEAFWGPNKTRIPLKGSFVLGKAYGDLVSERALIQIIAISSVLPSGMTFENEQNLGYITDAYGELGIHGQVVYNTGRQLALTFMSGFMSGGSQAVADQQVTAHRDSNGYLIRDVTGDTTKHALFSGLAQSAGKMSEYYAKQTENLIPAIHVVNGQNVYFIVQKGVTIHGLSPLDVFSGHYVD